MHLDTLWTSLHYFCRELNPSVSIYDNLICNEVHVKQIKQSSSVIYSIFIIYFLLFKAGRLSARFVRFSNSLRYSRVYRYVNGKPDCAEMLIFFSMFLINRRIKSNKLYLSAYSLRLSLIFHTNLLQLFPDIYYIYFQFFTIFCLLSRIEF